MASYRVFVGDTDDIRSGQQPEAASPLLSGHIDTLTRRVISALLTEKACSTFSRISEMCQQAWGTEHSDQDSARDFQGLLRRATIDPTLWPALVIDPNMDQSLGTFLYPLESNNRSFLIQDHFISLERQRFRLYCEDCEKNSPERYSRWIELFGAYCHEIGHMFIAYLHIRYEGPTGCQTPHVENFRFYDMWDSGYPLEVGIFGGVLWLADDDSSREPGFGLGAPYVEDQQQQCRGVALERVINLADKPLDQPYTDADFDLGLY